MTKIEPPEVLIMKSLGGIKAVSRGALSDRLAKDFPEHRPRILEIIKVYSSYGLICPTVEISKSQDEVVLTYDSWVNSSQLKVRVSKQGILNLLIPGGNWIGTTMNGIHRSALDIIEILKGN